MQKFHEKLSKHIVRPVRALLAYLSPQRRKTWKITDAFSIKSADSSEPSFHEKLEMGYTIKRPEPRTFDGIYTCSECNHKSFERIYEDRLKCRKCGHIFTP